MNSNAREHLEIERKYEVDRGAAVPVNWDASGLHADPAVSFDLSATYYDAADGLLAAHRIAVRKRLGGVDAGWHIKARGPEGVREFEWPVGETMPRELREKLGELIGQDPGDLHPIATIETHRTSVLLRDDAGQCGVEFVDDLVQTTDHVNGVARAWREWEAELVDAAPPAHLEAVETLLLAEGARASLSESKIGRAMGTVLQAAVLRGESAEKLAALAATDVADRLATSGNDPRVAQLRNIARNLED